MKATPIYPFTAIVGQEKMKLALILNVINPGLSGVLIRGEKGTAKSTAVRALADILPEIEVFAEDRFNLDPATEAAAYGKIGRILGRPAAEPPDTRPPGAIEDIEVRSRKADIVVETLGLVWTPWVRDVDGLVTPAFTAGGAGS